MALENGKQVWVPGVQGAGRIPGALGNSPFAGHSTDARGTKRLPGPLKIGPSILLMDSTVTKVVPKQFKMPAPTNDKNGLRLNVVTWNLGADAVKPTDVHQGGLANCPVASILAAMANTPTGADRLGKQITQQTGNVVTDISAAMDRLENDGEWANKPKGSTINSKGYFKVAMPGLNQEVSDVFYTDQGDRDTWDLIYMGVQGIHRDKGETPILWASVVEKAYAVQVGSYEELDHVNDPVVVWKALIGIAPTVKLIKDLSDGEIKSRVQSANKAPTIATTRGTREDNSVEDESHGLLEGWHGYTVIGPSGSGIELYDPFGKKVPVSIAQFRKFFTTMLYGGF